MSSNLTEQENLKKQAMEHGQAPIPILIMESVKNRQTYYHSSGFTSSGDIITDQSIFRIGSLTKIFTSIAVLQLAEQGKFSLDDKISRYLPELSKLRMVESKEDINNARYTETPITIWDLLLHTGGFAYDFTSDLAKELSETYPDENLSKCVFSKPGEYWRYSCGTEWLGKLVEVFGLSLLVYFQREIFEPLNMMSTSYSVPVNNYAHLVPTLQRKLDGRLSVHSKYEKRFRNEPVGDGGLFSTGNDITQFLRTLGSFAGVKSKLHLGKKSYELLTEPQVRVKAPSSIKSSVRHLSNDFNFIDINRDSWTAALLYKTMDAPVAPQPLLMGAGMFNTYLWLDLQRKRSGLVFSQILPFCDVEIVRIATQRSQIAS